MRSINHHSASAATARAGLLALIALLSYPDPSLARESETTTVSQRRTLRQAVEHALATHPEMKSEQLKVDRSLLAVDEVLNAKKPAIEFRFRTGLVPEAKGSIFESPDTNEDLDNLGIFWRFDLDVVQPITTFGKISSSRAAAEHGVRVQEFGRDHVAAKLGFEVVRAYLEFEAAVRGMALAEDLQDDYENLLEEVEQAVADPESDVDDTRLFEVQSFEFEIVDSRSRIQKDHEVTLALLETLLGWENLDDQSFEPVTTPALPNEDMLERLISLAMMESPAIQQARSGLEALDSRIDLAEASRWPDIFLALGGAYARAPNRTDIRNPFILDPFNLRTIGGYLGLRWNLKFAEHRLKISQSTVERQQASEQLSILEDRLIMEVTRSYSEALALSETLGAAKRSEKAAKSWLRLSGDNWDLGLGSVDRLVTAYGQYYELAAIVIEQETRYNLALARLAVTLGRIEYYLDWTEHATIEIR